jgi:hypothetical protein
MIRVYLDNDVTSAITQRDQKDPAEAAAIDRLLEWSDSKVELATSRQSPREMERAPVGYQAGLKAGLSGLQIAVNDHQVLGSFNLSDPYGGCVCNPIVTDVVDDALYSGLISTGLRPDDAKHLMYAVHNGYQRFLTWDKHFLSRKAELATLCPSIDIQKPSEFVAAMQ